MDQGESTKKAKEARHAAALRNQFFSRVASTVCAWGKSRRTRKLAAWVPKSCSARHGTSQSILFTHGKHGIRVGQVPPYLTACYPSREKCSAPANVPYTFYSLSAGVLCEETGVLQLVYRLCVVGCLNIWNGGLESCKN